MEYLSKRVTVLHESATIAMARLSRELTEKGHNIISLSLGEPDFVTPENICLAAKKAIDEGFTHYPPISGYGDLRKAISEKMREGGRQLAEQMRLHPMKLQADPFAEPEPSDADELANAQLWHKTPPAQRAKIFPAN